MLWLLRHGDAEDGTPDSERKLTAKGERQSRAAGEALAKLGVQLDICLSSPKVRAAQTARLACEPLGVEVRLESRLDFSQAVTDLTGARAQLKKGGLAGIDGGELKVLLRPGELEAIAGA
jgi:phosphohistidine phosphatase